MVNGSTGAAGLGHLHTLYCARVLGDLTDAQLLERFLAGHDEGAEAGFAALVERHGPMVLRVCGRILRDPHDAEDAFRATFLVLARLAGSLRRRESLASWLHGIARRVSLHARADAARRRRHEGRFAEMRDVESRADGDESVLEGWPELHEGLARLPAAYRESVVLYYLEGLTTAAAARRLGCAQGTVLARLSRARERLRRRLVDRGIEPPAGLTMGLAPDVARAAVPGGLARSVITATMEVASSATADGSVPATVADLAQGVVSAMFRTRLKGIIVAVVALGVVAFGLGTLAHRAAGARPQDAPTTSTATAAAPTPRDDAHSRTKDGRPAEIIVRAADLSREAGVPPFQCLAAIDPKTGRWRTIYKGAEMGPGPVSPDGRYLVYPSLGVDLTPDLTGIWVYDLTGQTGRPRRIFGRQGVPVWINDGRQVMIGTWIGPLPERFETWRVNADGTGQTRLPIPEGDLVLDASRNGAWLATRTMGGEPRHHGRLTLVHPDGTGARYLTEGSAKEDRFPIARIAPDGRSIAYVEITTVNKTRSEGKTTILDRERQAGPLVIVDIAGGQRRRIPTRFEPGTTVVPFWSPDGARLALNLLNSGNKEGSIVLVDLGGPSFHFRTLPLPPGRWNLLVCDWQTLAPGPRLEATDPPPDPKTLRGRYQSLIQEVEEANRIYGQALKAARTPEERLKVYREKFPRPRSYAGRFLQLAESAPSDPTAVDALVWIAQSSDAGPEFDRAIELLARDHAAKPKVGLQASSSLIYKLSPSVATLFRAVVDKNPDRFVRGYACQWLGQYLRSQSEAVRRVREDKQEAAQVEARFLEEGGDKEGFARFRRRDPEALMTQSEAAFERVVKDFADIPGSRSGTLGQEAGAALNEIRNLVPGKPAPEVTGLDVDGQPMKLSDHRGRVVLLSFRGQIPYERGLAARMQDRPFVLLGVNDETDKEKLRGLIKSEGLTWRSWWDVGGRPGESGPIARQFNVDTRPPYYLIDHRGIIRRNSAAPPAPAIWTPRSTRWSPPRSATPHPAPLERRGPGIYSIGSSA